MLENTPKPNSLPNYRLGTLDISGRLGFGLFIAWLSSACATPAPTPIPGTPISTPTPIEACISPVLYNQIVATTQAEIAISLATERALDPSHAATLQAEAAKLGLPKVCTAADIAGTVAAELQGPTPTPSATPDLTATDEEADFRTLIALTAPVLTPVNTPSPEPTRTATHSILP